nr:hypothetical protein [Tanacetum cinerariifolium]
MKQNETNEIPTPRQTKRGQDTEIPQSSGSPKKVGDKAVYIREDGRVVRVGTTATSLEAEQESDNINKTRSMETLNESSPQGTSSGSGPRCQDTTLGDADAQTRFETASKQSHDPPLLEVNISGSREDTMEHQDDLTDFIPLTPYDSPLSGGHTHGSDEDCSRLGDQKAAKESQKIGKEAKGVSKQGRNLKTRPMFEEGGIDDNRDDINDMVDEAIENVEGDSVNVDGAVNTATTEVSAASASVTTAGVSISTAEPRTPPTTITTAFEDEDLTIAKHLKRFFVAQRAAKQRSKPPTKAQMRNRTCTYLKNQAGYKYNQLKGRSYDDIQKLFDKAYKQVNFFIPMDFEVVKDSGNKDDSSSKQAGSRKKRAGSKLKPQSPKKLKVMKEQESAKDEQEKEEPRLCLKIETQLLGSDLQGKDLSYWKITRVDGIFRFYKAFLTMLEEFIRQDLFDLHRLVMKRFESVAPEGYESPQYGSPYQSQQYPTNPSSTPLSFTYPSNDYQSSVHHNIYSSQPSILQLEYAPTVNKQSQQPEFPQLDSSLSVPVFKQGDDPIDAINHMMSFLSAVVTSCNPTTNNQLWNSSNPMQQATINDGRCTKPKRKQDDAWFKDKVLLVQAQANGQILHEEELAFLADPGITEDFLAEVHNPDNIDNIMINQSVQAMPSSKHSSVVNHFETEITNDINIIPYSQVEVSKELPKVSMVNTSLKKLKHHLAGFDVVIKERTMATTITKGPKNLNKDKVKKDIDEIETINIELDHRVSKLIDENEHMKQTYKQLYDSIKPICVRSKEKSLRDELRKLKWEALVDNAITTYTIASDVVTKHTIASEMLQIDMEPLAPRLLNNRSAHSYYLRLTQEQAAILREVVEQEKSQNPLNNSLDSALGHNLFSVGQFYDSNLEVAFHQHTCFIRNLEGVDLLIGSRGKNLYTLSLRDMMASSSICLLSKALLSHGYGTNVKCLRSKDEALDFIIKFLKMIQVRLKASVRRIRINNRTEFVNQTLREYYEKQNGVVERRNRTLIEAARTMLIYAKAPLFLWAEAVATTCYTQNHSIIRLRHGKTPYEILHDKLPDLSFFHVFGALCYPENDSENLEKLQPKADIDFDELTTMAFEHNSLEPALHEMTPAIISSGLVPNLPPSTPYVSPSRTDWDILFQLVFDELLNPLPSVDSPAPEVIASIIEVVALELAVSTSSPSSTTVDQDAPSPSNSQTSPENQSLVISNVFEEENHDLDVANMNNDPFFGISIPENMSEASFSSNIIPTIVHTAAPNSEHINK